ncbi:hypothetical protein EV189_1467 [Motilibacter rhizosphaerae]|uniref:YtxH-like protein n=1 Tax=Motilibacter rhizosphaerae TaxID=598652 RepID=A0A4Q7NRZ2_9ACTN|nr:YtxH domain-containing protein [Motilibacter rhizosphaerae]RZS89694.1 hypothetical protein EV189_1467 [Motilibacter rhizosphaerae]
MRRLTFLAGFATGYVLGARAGRERYEQIARGYRSFAGNAKVQSVADKAKSQATDLASTAKDKAASKVSSAVHGQGPEHAAPHDDLDSVLVLDVDGRVATGDGVGGTGDRMGL